LDYWIRKQKQNKSLPVLVLPTEKEGDSRLLKQQGPFLNALTKDSHHWSTRKKCFFDPHHKCQRKHQ